MVDQNINSQFNEIYDSTYKPVLSYVTAKCGNTADIQDIVQETYVELYRALSKRGIEYIQNPKAFCLRLAKQKVSRHYSLVERFKMILPLSATNDDGDEVMLSDFDAQVFLETDFTVNHDLLIEIEDFLVKKPQNVKKVFYLFYDVGLTIPEIAAALSMSESSVKNKLYRTLSELKNLLK